MHYDQWADALAAYWLADTDDESVVLALEPMVLVDVAAAVGESFGSVEEAAADFLAAVRLYQHSLGSRPWRTEAISDERARFLLLIAVQVYAASQMDDDESGHHTSRAYLIQLEHLVGERVMGANFSADHGEAHRSLWNQMRKWCQSHGRILHLPKDRKGAHDRNVGLPKSQALLRLADLAELPSFFRECRYQPGAKYSLERVVRDVELRCDDQQSFPSSWARRVLNDELKLPTACRQIYNELKRWDGQWKIGDAGRRARGSSSKAYWWFGINLRKRTLIARNGETFENSRVVATDDLGDLLARRVIDNDVRLKLSDGVCLCRHDADDHAFKQVSSVEPGDRCLLAASAETPGAIALIQNLLSCANVAKLTQLYLHDVERDSSAAPLDGIPPHCVIAILEIADPLPSHEWVDRVWHHFLKSPRAQLLPTGGLRFGREANWVCGAGPGIRIVGKQLPKSIAIDGHEVAVKQRIVTDWRLSEAGEHDVHASIDGKVCSCSVLVTEAAECEPINEPDHGWVFDGVVPSWKEIDGDDDWLHGMRFTRVTSGEVAFAGDDRLAAIRVLANLRVSEPHRADATYHHPLARWLVGRQAAEGEFRSY